MSRPLQRSLSSRPGLEAGRQRYKTVAAGGIRLGRLCVVFDVDYENLTLYVNLPSAQELQSLTETGFENDFHVRLQLLPSLPVSRVVRSLFAAETPVSSASLKHSQRHRATPNPTIEEVRVEQRGKTAAGRRVTPITAPQAASALLTLCVFLVLIRSLPLNLSCSCPGWKRCACTLQSSPLRLWLQTVSTLRRAPLVLDAAWGGLWLTSAPLKSNHPRYRFCGLCVLSVGNHLQTRAGHAALVLALQPAGRPREMRACPARADL